MHIDEANRPVWNGSFSEASRAEQLREDSQAWRAVTGLLLAIIIVGVSLALFTAWMCLA